MENEYHIKLGKGEIACYNVFHSFSASKCGTVWKWVNT